MGQRTGSGGKDARLDKAVLAVMEHVTAEKAAAALGMSTVTLWRLMQTEEFQARLRTARRRAYAQCIGRLQQAASAAAATMLRIMTDASAPAASRLRAADAVLSHAAKALELQDMDARLLDLEKAVKAAKDPDGVVPSGPSNR
jgi:hypothetical protein